MIVKFEDDVAVLRILDISNIQEAVARYGGSSADYLAGDYEIGSRRSASVVTPPPPQPSDLSSLVLAAADFYEALAAEPLLDRSAMELDPETWLVERIAESQLPVELKVRAVTRARKAIVFQRENPDLPGLLDAVAAILPRADGGVGLSPSEVDAMFVRHARPAAPQISDDPPPGPPIDPALLEGPTS